MILAHVHVKKILKEPNVISASRKDTIILSVNNVLVMLRVCQMTSLPLEVVKFLPRRENYVLVKKMWKAEFVTLVNLSFGTFKKLMHLDVMIVAVIYQVNVSFLFFDKTGGVCFKKYNYSYFPQKLR